MSKMSDDWFPPALLSPYLPTAVLGGYPDLLFAQLVCYAAYFDGDRPGGSPRFRYSHRTGQRSLYPKSLPCAAMDHAIAPSAADSHAQCWVLEHSPLVVLKSFLVETQAIFFGEPVIMLSYRTVVIMVLTSDGKAIRHFGPVAVLNEEDW